MRDITYILPSQWREIDLTGDLQAQAKTVTERMIGEQRHGREVLNARISIERSLREQFTELAQADSSLLLMEVDPVGDLRTGTFLAVLPFPRESGQDPMDMLLAVASSTPGAEVFEEGELLIMRTSTVSDRTQAVNDSLAAADHDLGLGMSSLPSGSHVRSERLTYYVGHPEHVDDWMLISGVITTLADEDGQALAAALRAVCDAIVQSVRFQ
jgi:hypothetical protein